jgi:hypothetical protein
VGAAGWGSSASSISVPRSDEDASSHSASRAVPPHSGLHLWVALRDDLDVRQFGARAWARCHRWGACRVRCSPSQD